jgi:hypothetical protein
MNFLRDHPDETECCDLRFAEETGNDGSQLRKTFGFGYFLTLAHLENGPPQIRRIWLSLPDSSLCA